ncbi:TraX family protein [Cellulosilyticum ruminicola]|uniref:TraX family protein n=1 Tax=Cellulosilyticum ruminicola TaxID=425254 RepID=UPI0006D03666|nr:TraX family protein [Cellulosilyticum ruminicola]
MHTQKISLSGSNLKIIAITTMLIDHIGAVLFPTCYLLRCIGRLAFPIFCFLLVEGFLHTHNVRNYAIRLGIFAFISEIPFNLAISERIFNFSHQNVFFTLLIGLLVLIGLDKFKYKNWMQYFIFVSGMIIAELARVDYGCFGVIFIILFYLYHKHHKLLPLTISFFFFSFLANPMESLATLAILPIACYNGKRGLSLKYVFYAFYPTHLFILYLIAHLLHIYS